MVQQVIAVVLGGTISMTASIYTLLRAIAFVACILLAAMVPLSKAASAMLAAAVYALLSTGLWYLLFRQAYGFGDITRVLIGVARSAFVWLALVVATLHVFVAGQREWIRLALGLVVASLVESGIGFAFQPRHEALLTELIVDVVSSLLLTATLWFGYTRLASTSILNTTHPT